MVSTEPNAKNQHYVWQHYLNAWAAEGTFFCYRQKDKKLFPTQPKAVASQTYFYRRNSSPMPTRNFWKTSSARRRMNAFAH
jgi:hypothetical protein